MKKEEFYIGQLVHVREWDDLMREYGSDDKGIGKGTIFTAEIRKYCGTTQKIKNYFRQDFVRLEGCPYFFYVGTLLPASDVKPINEKEILALI